MLLLRLANFEEVVDLALLKTKSKEICCWETLEALLIEGSLEPLERKGTIVPSS